MGIAAPFKGHPAQDDLRRPHLESSTQKEAWVHPA
jgi:hypothetical protein